MVNVQNSFKVFLFHLSYCGLFLLGMHNVLVHYLLLVIEHSLP